MRLLIIKFLRWTAITVGVLVAVLLAASAVILALGISIDLSAIRGNVESTASSLLGRKVRIDGSIVLIPTLWPSLRVEGIRIANPPKWGTADFARMELARGQFGIIPLIKGNIHIREIAAEGVSFLLESNADGESNWDFGVSRTTPEKRTPPPASPDSGSIGFVALDEVTLRRVMVTYRDRALGESYEFKLDELAGAVSPGEPLRLSIAGSLQQKPYSFSLTGGPIADLMVKGKPWPLELSGKVAESPVEGKGVLALRGEEPEVNFELASGQVDIGALLHWLKIAEDIEVNVGRFGLKISAKGSSLRELLDQSNFKSTVQDGEWTLRDPNTQASLTIRILRGILTASAGKPIILTLDGRIDEIPVKIEVQGDRLAAYVTPTDRLSLTLNAEAAGARLDFEGAVDLPMSRNKLELKMSLKGERLDNLNKLLRVALPPLGPYAFGGRFSVHEGGYRVSGLEVRVRKSDLTGDLNLETKGARPRLEINLATKTLQINDFDVKAWSPITGESEGATNQAITEAAAKPAGAEEINSLLSPSVMRSLDAWLSVKVREVLSGKDRLGSGSLTMTLEDGRLSVAPLQLDIPGGSVNVELAYQPTEKGVAAEVNARIDRFDYGVLARRIDSETDLGGKITLDVRLKSRAKTPDVIMQNASGHFDIAIWPESFKAGIFDLWAVNLFSSVTSEMDKGAGSKINCAVARFKMTDGLMSHKAILIDTSRMRVGGEGQVNFKTEKIDMAFAPRGKKPEFFSLATPIKVHGSFADFRVGVKTGALAGTAIQFITSPIHAPIRRLFTKPLPTGGEDVCTDPMQEGSKAPQESGQPGTPPPG